MGQAAAGVLGALWAAGLGLLGVTLVVLLGWAVAATESDGVTALRAALDVWLLAHRGTLALPQGTIGLAPLGLSVLMGALLAFAAARAARLSCASTPRARALVLVSLAVTYGVLPLLVAPLAATDSVRPVASQAAGGALLLALVAGGAGIAVSSGRLAAIRAAAAPPVRACLDGVASGVALLSAAGALLLAGTLGAHLGRVADLAAALDLGVVDAAVLIVLCAALLPNAVIWAASYAVGPGFAVGAATSVTPLDVHLGAVPAFPLLGALPAGPPPAGVTLVVLLMPFVAGAVTGMLTVRRLDRLSTPVVPGIRGVPRERTRVITAAVAGILVALALALLAAVSGGAVGGGRMATLGPSAWQVGAVAAVELGLSAAVTAWALPPRSAAR